MHRFRFRRVELAVGNAGAGTHTLDFARPDHRTVAKAILMLECAGQHIGDDVHAPVRREAAARNNAVLIDDPHGTESHMSGIATVAERKGMSTIEPSGFRLAVRVVIAKGNRRFFLCPSIRENVEPEISTPIERQRQVVCPPSGGSNIDPPVSSYGRDALAPVDAGAWISAM